MKTHQQRLLAAIEATLQEHEPPLEMTWDQTVAGNVGFVGSVRPGEVTAHRRVHAHFNAEYATFKPVNGQRISDKGFYVTFGGANAEQKFQQVLAYLCGED